jgi:hypothetical protein
MADLCGARAVPSIAARLVKVAGAIERPQGRVCRALGPLPGDPAFYSIVVMKRS